MRREDIKKIVLRSYEEVIAEYQAKGEEDKAKIAQLKLDTINEYEELIEKGYKFMRAKKLLKL